MVVAHELAVAKLAELYEVFSAEPEQIATLVVIFMQLLTFAALLK